MREIKFRAWDKHEKVVFEVMSIDWEDIGQFVCDFQNKRHFLDEIELLQYTGLKDKNGKEIYEDDIVTHKPNAFGETVSTANLHLNCGDLSLEELEVIGNIYENPELLK